jgi:hypothetical protein
MSRWFMGRTAFVYDASRFLLTSADLPVVSQVYRALRANEQGNRASQFQPQFACSIWPRSCALAPVFHDNGFALPYDTCCFGA